MENSKQNYMQLKKHVELFDVKTENSLWSIVEMIFIYLNGICWIKQSDFLFKIF